MHNGVAIYFVNHNSLIVHMDSMSKFGVPVAIILAGGLIATALYFSGAGQGPAANVNGNDQEPKEGQVLKEVRGIQPDDHVLGNPNAPIVMVEYTDTECPFCKHYHETMHTIMDTYGAEGKVAWVYRHFPLIQLHSKAPKEAEAAECAGDQGGNDAFWKMIDMIYTQTPSNNGLDLAKLPEFAKEIGLDVAKFNECLSSGKMAGAVQEDYEEAVAAGGRGTPHTIVLFKGKQMAIEGAQPLEAVKGIIDAMIKEI